MASGSRFTSGARWVSRVVVMITLAAGLGLALPAPAHANSAFILSVQAVEPAIAGTTADLRVRVTNGGPDPADDVIATFTLPAGVTYAGDESSCASAPPVVTCSINTFVGLPVGASADVTIRVTIDPDFVVDNGGGTSTAEAVIPIQVAYDGGLQSKSLTVPVGERSDLRIRKYANPPVANAGETVLYSIDVDNLGPSTARNVTIGDTLFRGFEPGGTPSVTIQSCAYSVSQGGGAITQFTCTTGPVVTSQFGTDIGTFRTNKLQPIGAYDTGSGTFALGGRLRASFRLVGTETMYFDNETRVVAETFDPDNSNNLAVASHSIEAVADLSLAKTADSATAERGDTLTYTLTATNNGPSTAQNVVIEDRLPAGVELVSATSPDGVCIGGTPGDLDDPVVCRLGSIAAPPPPPAPPTPPLPNKTATIVVRVSDTAPLGSSLTNQAWVSSDVPDLDNSDDAAQAVVGIVDAPHLFNPVTPARQFDTRDGTGGVPVGKVPAGGTLAFTVTGVNGIPAGAAAVSLNVTAEGPDAEGFITVYPCASPRPLASNLNFLAGQTVANAVIAPVDPAGQVCFYSKVETNIISDVSGWFRPALGLTTVNPVREFDTRDGTGGVPVGPRPAGSVLSFKVTGVNGVPAAGVDAVALNVTVDQAGGNGHVTVFPCGGLPLASNLNYELDDTVPNLVVAPVSPQGTVCFYVNEATELLADLSGWFATGSEYHALNPSREFDTRNGLGGVPAQRLAAGSYLEIPVAGRHGVPLTGVGAVVLNVTAVNGANDGFVTVYPCGNRPLTSNVNFPVGSPVPNAVIAPVSSAGTVCFYVNAETDLLADISGWFAGVPV